MNIFGLQKMTLLDFPEHVACTVFLGGCDFRCPFCHNFELVDGTAKPQVSEEEFFSFLSKRKGLLDGVAITGGEPCLYPQLPQFIREIKDMGFAVKLDTNGYHPALLKQILEQDLADYIAMDIKNAPEKYARTVGLASVDLSKIYESIELLMSGRCPYEFRTTVVKEFHDATDFHNIGMMIRGAKQCFLQKFTDRDTVPFGNLHACEDAQMQAFARILSQYTQGCKLRGIS